MITDFIGWTLRAPRDRASSPARRRGVCTLGLLLAVAPLLSLFTVTSGSTGTPAGATTSRVVPPSDPLEDVPLQISPAPICEDVNAPTAACIDVVLHDINYARSLEGVPSMVLPTNFTSLTVPEQIEVLVNLERGDRGLSQFSGLSQTLANQDNATFPSDYDPPAPSGYRDSEYASNFAEGYNALLADYAWMYDDGYSGSNIMCAAGNVSGCWIHRDNILGSWNPSPGQTPELGAGCDALAGSGCVATGASAAMGDYSLNFAEETGAADPLIDPYAAASYPTSEVLPQVAAVEPQASAQTTAGTEVMIQGNYFSKYGGTPTVDFGGVRATNVTVLWDGELTAVAPADPNGTASDTVTVTVSTSAGTSSGTGQAGVNQFTYAPMGSAPTITSISPNSGPAVGTNPSSVVITGTHLFASDEVIYFGATQIEDFSGGSASITVTGVPPALRGGPVFVTVSNADGSSATSTADQYTYSATPAPTVGGLSASSGPASGGTAVAVAGSNFNGVSTVSFGGTDVPFTVNGAGSSLSVASPPGIGTVDVVVTAAGGTSVASAAAQFEYVGTPTSSPPPTTSPPPGGHGYWLVGSDGGIFSFGSAQFYGSTGNLRLQRPV
ncbi:MAG TPA: IPT/TIG domain-containing protein, partial [Acidimicrobiales bacterium]